MTRAELLRFAIARALRKVRVGSKRLLLSEETRDRIAADAVAELRRHGGWKALDEKAPIIRPPASDRADDKRENLKTDD